MARKCKRKECGFWSEAKGNRCLALNETYEDDDECRFFKPKDKVNLSEIERDIIAYSGKR